MSHSIIDTAWGKIIRSEHIAMGLGSNRLINNKRLLKQEVVCGHARVAVVSKIARGRFRRVELPACAGRTATTWNSYT